MHSFRLLVFQSIREYKKLLAWLFIPSIIAGFSYLLDGFMLKCLIDMVPTIHKVFHYFVLFLALWLYSEFFNIVWRFYDYGRVKALPRIEAWLINRLTYNVLGKDYDYFQNNSTGNIATKINDVAVNYSSIMQLFSSGIIRRIIVIVSTLISFYAMNSTVCIVFLVWIIIYLTILFFCNLGILPRSRNFAENRSRVFGGIVDIISNILSVRTFAKTGYESHLLGHKLKKMRLSESHLYCYELKIGYIKGLSSTILIVIISLILSYLNQSGAITISDFVMIFTITNQVLYDLWFADIEISQINRMWGICQRSLIVLSQANAISDSPNAQDLHIINGAVKFDSVCFSHIKQKQFFDNISLEIPGGQKVGLIGCSGSGKSTFIKLIARLFDVNSGNIYIDGQNIKSVKQSSLAKNISFVSQEISLFSRTILSNIRYAKFNASMDEIIEAAKLAHAHEFIVQQEEGYHTYVGENSTGLSVGEIQRIIIARAFLKDAPILILDEATSALDSNTEKIIKNSLSQLMQNKTVIIVAHRFSTITHMDRLIVFHDGKIVGDGNHKELMKNNEIYANMWKHQIGDFIQYHSLET